jgi:hypothetical protein
MADPKHGQPNATTFITVGDQQVSITWSEAPGGATGFDTKLDLTDPDSYQGTVPIVNGNGTDEYAEVDSDPITAFPFSLGVWAKHPGSDSGYAYMSVEDKDVANVFYDLGTDGSDSPRMRAKNTSTIQIVGGTTLAAGQWNLLVGVWDNATSRELFLNGSSEGTSATSVTYGAVDRASIGRLGSSAPAGYFKDALAGGPLGPFLVKKALNADECLRLYELGRRALGL